MAKPSTALTTPGTASIHPARGETSALSVYEKHASTIAPYCQELNKTGISYQMYRLLIGQELWQVRNRGRGELAKFIKLAKLGAIGVRMSKRLIDTSLAKFDACMKAIGYKSKEDIAAKIEEHAEGEQLNLALWEQGPPQDADEMWSRMYEWCQSKSEDTGDDIDGSEDDDGHQAGAEPGNSNAELTEEEIRENQIKKANAAVDEVIATLITDVYYAVQANKKRLTWDQVAAMEAPPQTWSLASPEKCKAMREACANAVKAIKWLEAQAKGKGRKGRK